MASGILRLTNLGMKGVNVDDDPLTIADTEYLRTQNAISDPLLASGVSKRPGWAPFNVSAAAGVVLGGVSVPFADQSTGSSFNTIYIGRGPTS